MVRASNLPTHLRQTSGTLACKAQTAASFGIMTLYLFMRLTRIPVHAMQVTGLGLQSIWSSVLYTNCLAVPPTALIGYVSGDFASLGTYTHGLRVIKCTSVYGLCAWQMPTPILQENNI